MDLLEGEEVMTLAVEEQALSVRCGGFTRRCPFLSPDEFPVLPSPNGNGNVYLSPDALDQLLGVGRFLAGGDDPPRHQLFASQVGAGRGR